MSHPEVQSMQKASRRSTRTIERLRFTFTPNGKREFVPRDQVFPLFSVYCLLLLHKISSFTPALSIRIALDCFYLLIFFSEKFSTDVCRLPYAVNVNLNLSNFRFLFSTLLTLLLSLLYKTLVAMRFPAKMTSSCIWVAIPVD